MAVSDKLHRSAFFQSVTVLYVLAILVPRVGGRSRHVCPTFPCGELRDVSSPFRRPGDPDGCGVPRYELSCSDTKATIRINTGTYYVVDINYTGSSFVVIDASLDMQSSCPLPRWDQVPYAHGLWKPLDRRDVDIELSPAPEVAWANFVNCSQAVRNNHMYRKVDCLSTSSSYVYVYTSMVPLSVGDFEASCGYLALIPLGGFGGQTPPPVNVSFTDVVRFMRHGFVVLFPYSYVHHGPPLQELINIYIHNWIT